MSSSLHKSLELLMLVSQHSKNEGLSVKELSNLSQLSPSTVHRFLQVFKEFDLIEQDISTKNYRLGPKLLKLGMQVRGTLNLRKAALPIMEKLTEVTGEDSHLTIINGNKGVFIEKVQGQHPAKIIETYGTEVPLHCGAQRLALLSFQEDSFIESYLKRDLESYTDKTITDPEKLREEITKIQEQGYALSFNSYVNHGAGVAAPVRDENGQVVASLGIIGFTEYFAPDRIDMLIKEVSSSAYELSNKLGYYI